MSDWSVTLRLLKLTVLLAVFVAVPTAEADLLQISLEDHYSLIEQWSQEGPQLHPAVATNLGGGAIVVSRSWEQSGNEVDLAKYWDSNAVVALLPTNRCRYLAGSVQSLLCVQSEIQSADVNARLILSDMVLPTISRRILPMRNDFAKIRYAGVWSDSGGLDTRVVYSVLVGGVWRLYYHASPFMPGDVIEVRDLHDKTYDIIEPAVTESLLAWVEYNPDSVYDEQYVVAVGDYGTQFQDRIYLGPGRFPSVISADGRRWYAYESQGAGEKRIVYGEVDLSSGWFSRFELDTPCAEPSRPIISNVDEHVLIAYMCGPDACSAGAGNATLYLSSAADVGKECIMKVAELGFRPGEDEPSPFSFSGKHLVYTVLIGPGASDYDLFYERGTKEFAIEAMACTGL